MAIGIGFDIGFTQDNVTAGAVVEFLPNGRFVYLAGLVFEPDMRLPWEVRVTQMGHAVLLALREYRPDFVVFETSHAGANVQNGLKLAHLGGCILLAGGLVGSAVYPVQPSQAKKALAKHGAADKADMIEAARSAFGVAFGAVLTQYPIERHSHLADAGGIVLAGYDVRTNGAPVRAKKARKKKAQADEQAQAQAAPAHRAGRPKAQAQAAKPPARKARAKAA